MSGADDKRAAKREYMRARRAAMTPEQREAVKVQMLAYDKARREKKRAANSAHYKANREKRIAASRTWAEANREKARAKLKRWKVANPERSRELAKIGSGNRRARQRAAPGKFTADDIKRIHQMQKGRCAYCKANLQHGQHIDHITPLVRGGSNWPTNLQLTCESCNKKKNRADPIEFAQRLGWLL